MILRVFESSRNVIDAECPAYVLGQQSDIRNCMEVGYQEASSKKLASSDVAKLGKNGCPT